MQLHRTEDEISTGIEVDGVRWEPVYRNGKAYFSNAAGDEVDFVKPDSGLVFPRVGDAVEKGMVLYPSRVQAPPYSIHAHEDLFEELLAYLDRYTPMPSDFRLLAAGFTVATWSYDQFTHVPYLQFMGETGTGKTRCLDAVIRCSYHPLLASGSDTEASLFRTMDLYPGSTGIDEADYRSSGPQDPISQLLTWGYMVGEVISRCGSKHDGFRPEYFSCGGPKVLSCRVPHDDPAIRARCFRQITTGLPQQKLSEDEAQMESDALELANRMLYFRLTEQVTPVTEFPTETNGVNGHTARVALPLITIARHFGIEELERVVVAFVQDAAADMEAERETTSEATVILTLRDLKAARTGTSVTDIADHINEWGMAWDYPGNRATPKQVGRVLATLGLKTRRGGERGRHMVQVTAERLEALVKAWGLPL
jgi:hypothetical protein